MARLRRFTAGVLCLPLLALGGTLWDGGGGDDNFGTGDNWDPNGSPGVGNTIDLYFGGNTRLTPNNDYTAWDDFRGIYFNSGAGSFVIGGNPVDLYTNSGQGKIENNSISLQTLAISFSLNGGTYEINPVSGDLRLSGANVFNNGNSFNVWGTETLFINSDLTGSGGFTIKQGGTVVLETAATYSGDSVVEHGTLEFAQGGSAVNSTIRLGATSGSTTATLTIGDTDGGTTVGNTLVVRNGSSGTKTIGGLNTSGVNTYSGTVALDDAVTLSAASGGRVDFTGAISDGLGSGTFGLLVGGSGTVRFAGGSANSGVAQYTVANGATLELAKTAGVNAVDSALTVNNGGTVRLVNANQITDGAAVVVDGTFDLNGQAETIGSLAGAASGSVTTGGAQLIAGQNNASTTFAGVISGSGSLVKNGSGTLTLGGANTYSGETYAVGGTLQFNAAQGGGFTGGLQLGETSGADAATLAIGTGGVTLANDITVRAGSSGVKTIAANNTTGTATFSGTTTLNDAVTLRAVSGGALTMGAINQGAHGLLVQAGAGNTITLAGNITGTGYLEKSATFPGTVVLTGVKSSTGDLRINDGTFAIGSGGDVTAGAIYLGSNVHQLNTTLELAAAGVDIDRNISVENAGGGETRTISSTAASGTTTLSGWVDLKKNLSVNANSGSTLAITTGVNLGFAGNNDLNLSNSSPVNITGAIAAVSGASDLNKSGSGTLTIGGDNSGSLYKLNLAGGTTYLTHANALGTAYSDKVNFLTANSELRVGATMAPASLGLTINNVTATVNTDSGVTFTVPGVVAGAGGTSALTKSGDGTLVLSGPNTYTGVTSVSAGVLNIQNDSALGTTAGATSVTSGAALELQGGITVGAEALTLSGTGVSSGGALRNVSGNNTYGGLLTLGSAAQINSDAGSLTLSNPGTITGATFGLTVGGSGDTTIAGLIGTTSGTLTKDGGGTLTLTGDNSFTGATTINGGTLQVGAASGAANSGTLVSSAGITNNGSLVFRRTNTTALDMAGPISGSGSVTYNGSGVVQESQYLVNSSSSYLGGTTVGAARASISVADGFGAGPVLVQSGGQASVIAAVTLANNFTINGNGWLEASGSLGAIRLANNSGISGTVSLGSDSRITASDGATGTISGAISGGFGVEIGEDTATGKVVFSVGNSYTGPTSVSFGALNIQNATGLGTTANGTSVSSDAALELQGSITVGAEALTLNGTGIASGGALRNISGSNNFGGLITLGSASRINSDAGTLTISNGGTITGATFGLTVGGAGNTSIASIIGTTSGSLTKDGAGTLTLSGPNTYAGGTFINGGRVSIGSDGNLGDTAGDVTFGSGYSQLVTGTAGLALNAGRTITLNGGATAAIGQTNNNGTYNFTLNGQITGSGALQVGRYQLGSGSTFLASTANDFTGSLIIGNFGSFTAQAWTWSNFTVDVASLADSASPGSGNIVFGTSRGTAGDNATFRWSSSAVTGLILNNRRIQIADTTAGNTIAVLANNNANAANTVVIGSDLLVTATAAKTLQLAGLNTGNNTFSGLIANGSAAISLTKAGAGNWILSNNNNSYTGPTTISAGTLSVSSLASGGSPSAIGAAPAAAANLVLSGGTLLYTGGTTAINRAFTLTNATNSGIDVSNGATSLTISGTSATTTGALTKLGSGTLVLSGPNAYSGGTTVRAGTLGFGVTAALGSGSVLLGDTTGSVNASLLAMGAFTLGNNITVQSGSSGVMTMGGDTAGNSTFNGNVTLGTASGAQRNLTLVALAGGTAEFTGVFNENTGVPASNITVGDAGHSGTVRLSNTGNGYSGITSIGNGAVLEAAEIDLGGNNSSIGNAPVAASNLVIDNGTLRHIGAANSTDRLFTIGAGGATLDASGAGDAALVWTSTSALATSGTGTRTLTLTGSSAGANSISAIIPNDGSSNATSLAKTGPGTWVLAGSSANTFTGQTTVSGGMLDLNKSAGVNAIAGDGSTGTNDVLVNGGTLRWLASEQMPSNASIGLTSGAVNLNGRTETLYSFSNSGGTFSTGVNGVLIGTGATVTWSGGTNTINDGGLVQDAHLVISGGVNTVEGGATSGVLQLDPAGLGLEMTGGVLTLNSDNNVAGKLRLQGDVTTFASATASEINSGLANANPGNVDLDGGTRTFTVADGAAASDLTVGARVQNGALVKAGAGTMTLTGDNTFAGSTAVNAGALNIRHANALGTTAAGTTVSSGAALELQGGFTSAAEALSLTGTGISGAGALRNVSGDNTFTGAITLAGDTRISSDSGTLSLNSPTALNGGGSNLSFGGAGNTSVSSVLNLGSGALTKVGAGTFTLSSDNTIAGATSVSAGTMRVSGTSGFTGAVSVSSGATLDSTGGTLGVDNLTVSSGGAFEWSTGRLTHATATATEGTTLDDASSPGYQFVMPGKVATITGNVASDSGSVLQMHGQGAKMLYGDVVSGVRFNTFVVDGNLDLSAGGDTLALNLDPFLLRPLSPQGQAVYEWGSIPLVRVINGNLTGAMALSGLLLQGNGFFQQSGLSNPGDGDDLALNEWALEFDETEDTIYFHYKIMGYVPEPGSFGLFFAGAAALRLMRRLSRSRRQINSGSGSVESDPVTC